MRTQGTPSRACLGFLTVIEHPQYGLFGGYLVLNTAGRPVEFHCTAPIKPNRAQEILYGPTLEPFLYGEQIGGMLLAKAGAEPVVVCTDCRPALAVREHVDLPVALVLTGPEAPEPRVPAASPASPPDASEGTWRLDAAHAGQPHLVAFQLGRNRLAVAEASRQDRQQIAQRVGPLAESFDLAEPFGRIREAIEEARRRGRAD